MTQRATAVLVEENACDGLEGDGMAVVAMLAEGECNLVFVVVAVCSYGYGGGSSNNSG